ncbi:MAG: response regulator transcription factor [Burkholderiales bacterium]|nr:response regulator transcription factor [Burkholderiales bacterium]
MKDNLLAVAVLDIDPTQTDLICGVLTSTGHECQPFHSAKELLLQLRKDNFDMLILDWQVPDLSGVEVLRQSRDNLPANMPVLVLANRSGEDDIIEGMDAGANDYMVKPIRRVELVARVQALLRRAYPDAHNVEQIKFGDYVFETRTGRLLLNNKPIELTQKEFDLALLLFRNLGRPLSRTFIHETVWSRDAELVSRTMDTHVSRVRNKLQLRPENGYRLAPVYSYGYRLEQIGAGHNGVLPEAQAAQPTPVTATAPPPATPT